MAALTLRIVLIVMSLSCGQIIPIYVLLLLLFLLVIITTITKIPRLLFHGRHWPSIGR